MSDTTTTVEPAKRGRNGSVILTDRMCEKRVAKRTKIYDRKCPGLRGRSLSAVGAQAAKQAVSVRSGLRPDVEHKSRFDPDRA